MVIRRFIPSDETDFYYLTIDSDDRVYVPDMTNNRWILLVYQIHVV